MIEPQPKRPWWKRKRWWNQKRWIAAIVLFELAYVSSAGPVSYGVARGWIPQPVSDAYLFPLGDLDRSVLGEPISRYLRWWVALGERHAAAD